MDTKTNPTFTLYPRDTELTIPERNKEAIINDILNNKRHLFLPRDFCREIETIMKSFHEKKLTNFSVAYKKLSSFGLYALHFSLLVYLSTHYGAGWIINYLAYSNSVILTASAGDALEHINRNYDLCRIPGLDNLFNLLEHTARCIPTYYATHHARYFPVLRAVIDQCTSGPAQSVEHAHHTIVATFKSYQKSLSPFEIYKSIRQTITMPKKTCFSTTSSTMYIGLHIEQDILQHFNQSMRIMGQVIGDHLPAIHTDENLSWIGQILHATRRFVEPLVLIRNHLSQQKTAHPLLHELQAQNNLVQNILTDTKTYQVTQEATIGYLTQLAHEMYVDKQQDSETKKIIAQQGKVIATQMKTIYSQEIMIKALTQNGESQSFYSTMPDACLQNESKKRQRSLSL